MHRSPPDRRAVHETLGDATVVPRDQPSDVVLNSSRAVADPRVVTVPATELAREHSDGAAADLYGSRRRDPGNRHRASLQHEPG